MTGKIFPESNDIYQDQARVLFDYYRAAAERIVAEERGYEQQIDECNATHQQKLQRIESCKRMAIAFGAAAVASIFTAFFIGYAAILLVLGFAAAAGWQLYTMQKETNAAQQIAQQAEQLAFARQNVRRSYHVDKIGVAYVPVAARVPAGNKSFVVDFTGEQPDSNFSITLINQPDELRGAMKQLSSSMEEMPAVESNDETEMVDTSDYSTSMQDVTLHDYMGSIDRQVRNVGYLINDNRNVSVSIPVVAPTSQQYGFLEEHATPTPGNYPVVSVFDTTRVQQQARDFAALGALSHQAESDGSGDVRFYADVMRQLAQGVDLLARSRTLSVSKLTSYTSSILRNVLKASFDEYSPILEAEEIERIRTATFNYVDEVGDYVPFALKESSRVRYDIFADAWVADDGSRTAMPFGMHQVDAEVLMPVISNLMQDNRKERLRIYNDIQNQKVDYLNQWHRDTDDFFGRNRTEANALIQRMNEAFAEYTESYTNYKQQSATFGAMKASGNLEDAEVAEAENQAEVIAGFQMQASQARSKQDEFTSFMDRIREDIDASAERFSHVEYYEASLRDSQARANARAVAEVENLDPRRRRLVSVSPYLAQAGTIPPEPRVSEQLDEDFAINLRSQAEQEISSLASDSQPLDPSSGREASE